MDTSAARRGVPSAESQIPESAPAPLLVPGRPSPGDSTRLNRQARARGEYQQGLEYERINAFGAAILSYQLAVRDDPQIADARYRVGMLYFKAGQTAVAAKAFAAELKQHPDNEDAARQLGLALAQLGQQPRALAQLERLTARRPGDGENWRALGYAYMLARRPRDAETALRRAIALPPPSALEHRDLGFVLAQTGREDEARAEYRKAIAMDPNETGAWINLANLDRKRGDFEPALSGFREAEKRDSSLAPAVKGEALVLQQLGRDAEAAPAYRRLLDLDAGDESSRAEAVRLFAVLGRADIALEVARDGVRHDERSGEARLILATVLRAQGHARDGVREMRRAESLFTSPGDRERARRLIDGVNATASDSLRVQLEADSVAFARQQARRPAAGPPELIVPNAADSLYTPARPDSR